MVRRVVGALIVAGAAVLLVFAATKVIGLFGGGDPDRFTRRSRRRSSTSDLTIPEGLDRQQIAGVAKKAKLKGNYEKASKSFKGFDPGKYGAGNPPNLEGFLFPATYELPDKATRQGSRLAPARRVQGQHRRGRPLQREVAESQRLRRAQDRLDDRARGAGPEGAQAGLPR